MLCGEFLLLTEESHSRKNVFNTIVTIARHQRQELIQTFLPLSTFAFFAENPGHNTIDKFLVGPSLNKCSVDQKCHKSRLT